MKTIGFRAEKDRVQWAFVEGTMECPILLQHDHVDLPVCDSESDSLCRLRDEILSLLEKFCPDRVAVRLSETDFVSTPTKTSFEMILRRARIEGVILEVCQTEKLEIMELRTRFFQEEFSPRLSKKRFRLADMQEIDWSKIKSQSRRQAILAAGSFLPSPCAAPS